MLDLNLIREEPDLVRQSLQVRQMETWPVDSVLKLDERRRDLIQEVEGLKAERNTVSKEIGRMTDAQESRPCASSPDVSANWTTN
jgi:seryl-tRNA synthetase